MGPGNVVSSYNHLQSSRLAEEILYGRKTDTETCVAPRYGDASRDAILAICSIFFIIFAVRTLVCFIFILFPRNEGGAGGGCGGCAVIYVVFSFCSIFPYSADHERDWPGCESSFFELLATNTLNVTNNIRGSRCVQILL